MENSSEAARSRRLEWTASASWCLTGCLEAPDHPNYSVRPILRRYLDWGRPALARLNAVASVVWEPSEQAATELVFTDRCSRTSHSRR